MARASEPGYALIARTLRDDILRGEYRDGKQLPTEAELSDGFSVSRQTVRRAFQELVSEQLVYRVPGRGTFAKSHNEGYVRQVGSVDDLMGLADDTTMTLRMPLERKIDLTSASRLRLASDVVYEMRFTRAHDDAVFCTTEVYLPPDVGKALTDIPEFVEVGCASTLTVIARISSS